MYHLFALFVGIRLVGNVIADSLIAPTTFSFHGLKVNQAVKVGVEGQWKFGNYQGVVRFHKLKSLAHVGWHLTVKSDLAALSLEFCQQWLPFTELVETTAHAIQVLWNHGRIMKLGKCVLIRETALEPIRPIM